MNNFFSIPFSLDAEINFISLLFAFLLLIIICFKLIFSRKLVNSTLLMSLFSLVVMVCYLFMDAADVAMTEAALNVCVSTCVLIKVAKVTKDEEFKLANVYVIITSAILCIVFVFLLTFASLKFPLYSYPKTKLQWHLTEYYLENTKNEIGIPSVVTAILASYRGYDTLGETAIILLSGISILLILSCKRSKK